MCDPFKLFQHQPLTGSVLTRAKRASVIGRTGLIDSQKSLLVRSRPAMQACLHLHLHHDICQKSEDFHEAHGAASCHDQQACIKVEEAEHDVSAMSSKAVVIMLHA